ncbi:phage holin family protein [Altericroceibacterium xinjiangense]|uniref:phage holin family protein n=1 Tax=Altericroceibacterium xinjiangense TaxID=762261 RepID=UPI001F495B24|nr:phage holin family protein [Altericroceibacterium xinjiangense]
MVKEELAPPPGGERVRFEPLEADPAPPPPQERSLVEDVSALFEDGKTYAQAELNFQKTRATFAMDRGKKVAMYGAVAGTLAFVALIALAVGLIIALTPLISAWGATAVVVGVLLIGAAILGMMAYSRVKEIMNAFSNKNEAS